MKLIEHNATLTECPYILSIDTQRGDIPSVYITQGDGFGNISRVRITISQLNQFLEDLKSITKTPHQ